MSKEVTVRVKLPHNGKKVGESYPVSSANKAAALSAIGLVDPANQTAAKAVEKVGKPE